MSTPPSQDSMVEIEFASIEATDENLQELWDLTHSHSRLQKAGYVLWQLGPSDLDKKKRCRRCSKVIRKGHERAKSRAQSVKLAPTLSQLIAAGDYPRPSPEPEQTNLSTHARSVSLQVVAGTTDISGMMQNVQLNNKDGKDGKNVKGKETGPPMNCKYHPGRIQSRASHHPPLSPIHHIRANMKFWTCCGSFVSDLGCTAEQFHAARVYRRGELEGNWEYFSTPGAAPDTPTEHRAAVVFDCEMGTASSGESELIRVSAVDFFTREVLVDSHVWPDVRMAHFNTRYSGVTRQSMEAARRARRTLAGRAGARAALWRFVGPRTVLVGHSANSDLNSLRWIHAVVIDTLLLEMRIQPQPREDQQLQQQRRRLQSKADGDEDDQQHPVVVDVVQETVSKEDKQPKYPGLSLKALAAERLKRTIQIKGQGHDSLEDALATRDLLLWHMVHKPEPPIIH